MENMTEPTNKTVGERETFPKWRPIAALPATGRVLAGTDDGRLMFWDAGLLRTAMGPSPSHLQFPAVAWIPYEECQAWLSAALDRAAKALGVSVMQGDAVGRDDGGDDEPLEVEHDDLAWGKD